MNWAKALSIFLLSSVKFLFAPGTSVAAGFGFWETFVITSSGGITGILFFYFFGRIVFLTFENWQNERRLQRGKLVKEKRTFTKRNRLLINLKNRFGLIGLAALTPAIISIPIGCILAAKFYYGNRITLPLLLVSTLIWSLFLTFFATYIKGVIFYS